MTPLRAIRERRQISLDVAAKKVGVAPAYLAQLERRGGAALTYPRARRLAALYGCSLTELVIGGRSERESQNTQSARRGCKNKLGAKGTKRARQ